MIEREKVILITSNPFNQRDYHRFGIATLRKNGFIVEIWDISPVLHKKYLDRHYGENTVGFQGLRVFKEKKEITNAISSLDNKSLILYMIEYTYRTYFIMRAISRKNIPYCVWGFATLPSPVPAEKTYSILDRIKSLLKKGSALKTKEIIQHIVNKILLDYYYFFGIAPASIILLGGEKSSEHPSYPVNDLTKRLWAHYLDYDIYLQKEGTGTHHTVPYGVFLDQYLPFHPDFIRSEIDLNLSPDHYYHALCNFFDKYERENRSKILIAAHPRSEYDKLPDYFCGRTIVRDRTAELVEQSSLVITHASTSIFYAILYHKPILIITTDYIQKMSSGKNLTGLYITAISSELGKKPLNIDHMENVDWVQEMRIDEDAYRRYKNLYIKKEGTPEIPVWEIFSSYLLEEN